MFPETTKCFRPYQWNAEFASTAVDRVSAAIHMKQ